MDKDSRSSGIINGTRVSDTVLESNNVTIANSDVPFINLSDGKNNKIIGNKLSINSSKRTADDVEDTDNPSIKLNNADSAAIIKNTVDGNPNHLIGFYKSMQNNYIHNNTFNIGDNTKSIFFIDVKNENNPWIKNNKIVKNSIVSKPQTNIIRFGTTNDDDTYSPEVNIENNYIVNNAVDIERGTTKGEPSSIETFGGVTPKKLNISKNQLASNLIKLKTFDEILSAKADKNHLMRFLDNSVKNNKLIIGDTTSGVGIEKTFAKGNTASNNQVSMGSNKVF